VARASAGLSAGRIIAAVLLLASATVLYGVTVSDAFTLEPDGLRVEGAIYTGEEAVRDALGIDQARPNLFRLRAQDLAERLRELPSVASADVRVALPDRLVVSLDERTPILAWRRGGDRFLVDVEGVLFAHVPASTVEPRVPIVDDLRTEGTRPAVGDRLETAELGVVRQLAGLQPSHVGSTSEWLRVTLDDENGYSLVAHRDGWTAVFGFYTQTIRTADLVPRQVQCLAELLVGREERLARVYLSPEGERCGTYEERPAP
jgi:cell division septal protein FtsQ